ncbi:aminoglycoside phosphotransferase family protein [soil metagenome]
METGPFETTAIDAYASKSAWDAAAAELVGNMLHRWNLTAGTPFAGGEAASVLRVTMADGTSAVLKVGFPHVEAIWEAVGLEAWGPALAPRVLRQDAWTWSLLLEDVQPGIPLLRYQVPAKDALRSAARLYGALSAVPVPAGVPRLDDSMRPFLDKAVSRLRQHLPILGENGDVLEGGLAALRDLLDSAPGDAFLHGDFNPGNVISSNRGWRAIDPKPMRGDAAFDLWPLISQLGSPWTHPHPEQVLLDQLQFTADIAGVDVQRAARWGFARAALNVSWFLDDQNGRAALAAMREAKAWRAVAG